MAPCLVLCLKLQAWGLGRWSFCVYTLIFMKLPSCAGLARALSCFILEVWWGNEVWRGGDVPEF